MIDLASVISSCDIFIVNRVRIGYPPAREASGEVANLAERKNLHTPIYVTSFSNISYCINCEQLSSIMNNYAIVLLVSVRDIQMVKSFMINT